MKINEVAPPGFGHTKGDKEKGVKRGGTAAAFDRARKEGRFKGSKSDMFAIMWSQKNKGDKPHYKPGTDKKYEKYQEEVEIGENLLIKQAVGGATKMAMNAAKTAAANKVKDIAVQKAQNVVSGAISKIQGEGFSDWRTELVEKDLNAAERRSLPDKDFVFPGKGEGPEGKQRGAYPIPDKKHARAALAMSAAHASPAKQAKVKAAVEKKFPGIEVSEENLDEAERNWYKGYDSGDKTVPRRKALNRADEFDNKGQNERADKIRSIAAKKDQGRHYEAKKDAKKIKISDKIGKLRPASIDDKRGAVSGDVQKKLSSSYELEGEVIDERVGGTGTLVRQGVKVGGKKGGRAVQAGQSAAVKAGQGAKVKAAQGNQSKMIGTGRAEKIGAVAGGLAGGVALGALDGPVVPVGDIVGGIAGSKIGGKIGRQVDKAGSAVKKAVVGEGIVDKVVKHYRDKKKPKKHQYPGRDAGKLAKDRLADKEHNKYVNFLPAEKD